MEFESLKLSEDLLTSIKRLGFTDATDIQEQAIPHILAGEDVIGESATGSGKTLAFGAGIIQKVVPKNEIQALILTPTRELAEQVKDHLSKFSSRLKTIAIYGGVSLDNQVHEIRNAQIVVSTPGRLCDHLQRKTIDLSKIKILVLDEADRMLDMGFITDVERIIKICPRDRQTMFFSATLSYDIKKLAKRYMKDPVQVSAKIYVDPAKLKQAYYDVLAKLKMSLLVYLLKEERSGLVMIFCNTRRTTDIVVKNLKANKIDAIAIHGGFAQNKRTKTLKSFNDAKVGVLVCTDVAARGLHVDNVSHVYNYEIPQDPKDYCHRIGRTARAGKNGKVINLISDRDHDNFRRLLNQYRDFMINKIDLPDLRNYEVKILSNDRNRGKGNFPKKRFGKPSHSIRKYKK